MGVLLSLTGAGNSSASLQFPRFLFACRVRLCSSAVRLFFFFFYFVSCSLDLWIALSGACSLCSGRSLSRSAVHAALPVL